MNKNTLSKLLNIESCQDYIRLFNEVTAKLKGNNPTVDSRSFPIICEALFAKCKVVPTDFWSEHRIEEMALISQYYLLAFLQCDSVRKLKSSKIRRNGLYTDELIEQRLNEISVKFNEFWEAVGSVVIGDLAPSYDA